MKKRQMWYEVEGGLVDYDNISVGYAVHSPIGDKILPIDYTHL